MPKIEIDVDVLGRGTFKVDGQDIGNTVESVFLRCKAGDLTEVQVVLRGNVSFTTPDAELEVEYLDAPE